MDDEFADLDDMPAEARALADAADADVAALQAAARRRVDEIRLRADREVAEAEAAAEEAVRIRQEDLLRALRPMQRAALEAGDLDGALAIRGRVRALRASLSRAQDDPGNLSMMANDPPGTSRLFVTTGSTYGPIWGTDVYTTDSDLSTAAVHAGVLRPGERGIVRVTLVDSLNVAFMGTQRNGVDSGDYGAYPAGYRVSRP